MEGADMRDLTAMLSSFMDSSGNIDPSTAPPDMADLLQRLQGFQEQARSSQAPARSRADTPPTVVNPKPGFVVKALDASGHKVFLNICESEHVLSPPAWQQSEGDQQLRAHIEAAVKGFQGSASELLRFPMSLGDPRLDKDHSGEPCTVLDIVFSPRVVQMAESSRPLKVFLVELALGWAGEAHGLQLHGDWKLPKMRYKGSPTPQKLSLVRQQQKLTEVGTSTAARQKPQQAAAQASQPKDSGHGETQEKASAAVTPGASAQAPHRPEQSQGAAELQQGSAQQGERLRTQAQGSGDAGAASSAASDPHGGSQQGRDSKAAAWPMPSAGASQAGSVTEEASTGKTPYIVQQPLTYSLAFHGRPVESVEVTINIASHAEPASSGRALRPLPSVRVRRDEVTIELSGRPDLLIQLPFGVDAGMGRAQLLDKERILNLRMPFKSYRSFTQDACKRTPLINDYGFPDSYFMQLET
ncbi:hypothetical protein CVIRNUC_006447 [Coccomyxa viridis]|uniref:PIH1 N-terminal domain-containing protein n=1 Tax=Coccomyxa viridis TaxID=1274662 RepID=A0AAV1I7V8_9CHLO|nr:hypothetical protein CVIRNUC_006447 [Coccomyxa viridis]